MPKAGPSPLEWKRRLEAFARGEYVFSTGQKPRKPVLASLTHCMAPSWQSSPRASLSGILRTMSDYWLLRSDE